MDAMELTGLKCVFCKEPILDLKIRRQIYHIDKTICGYCYFLISHSKTGQ